MITSNYDFTKIPFKDIIRVGQISMLYKDTFTVSWILGRYCNYRCSYCWEHGRSDKKDHRSIRLIMKTINNIKTQARILGFNSFHFSFSGGEPTYHPDYLKIIEELGDDSYFCNTQSIHMTTNLSRSIDWLKEYANLVSRFHRASVTASYHLEYVNKKEFLEKVLLLQEYDIHITINMVMVPKWFNFIYDIALSFHNEGINVTLKPQSDIHANYIVKGYTKRELDILHNGLPQIDYTKYRQKGIREKRPTYNMSGLYSVFPSDVVEDAPKNMQIEFVDHNNKKWYMDQAERFNAFNFNKFKGWECSSGYRSIIIREPCGSIKRSYSCIDEPLGNIETDFKLFDKPVPCISSSCVSSADLKIPKRKVETKLPLFPGDITYE